MTAESRTALADRLRADVARLVGLPAAEIGDEDDLTELGLDSVRLMTLVNEWSGAADLSFGELIASPSIAAWTALLADGTRGAGAGEGGDGG